MSHMIHVRKENAENDLNEKEMMWKKDDEAKAN